MKRECEGQRVDKGYGEGEDSGNKGVSKRFVLCFLLSVDYWLDDCMMSNDEYCYCG